MEPEHGAAHGGVRLEQILSDLAPLLTAQLVSRAQEHTIVAFAEFWDEALEEVAPGTILLLPGVDLREPDAELSHLLVSPSISGLVLADSPGLVSRARALADSCRLPIAIARRGTSWFQIAGIIRERLLAAKLGVGDYDGIEQMGQSLTQIAEAVGALIGAPVIIQDPDFRIQAYSQHDGSVDPARAATVLAASLPDEYRRVLDEVGAIERVYNSEEAEFIELGAGLSPRLAVAIRAGADVLGSIWAAVSGPVQDHQRIALKDAAGAAALAMLQRRSVLQARKSSRDRLVATLLTDSQLAGEARSRLGLGDRPLAVLVVMSDNPKWEDADRQRTARALDLHLRLAINDSATVILDDAVYGVVPLSPVDPDIDPVIRSAERFYRRLSVPTLRIGVGRPSMSAEGVMRSRREAETAARAERAFASDRRVSTFEQSLLEISMMALRDRYISDEVRVPFGAMSRLAAYEERQPTDLLRTLGAVIDYRGDAVSAARALNVHPNTVRYRIGRIEEVSGIRLDDADAMFLAELQLRVMRLAERSGILSRR